MSKVLTRAQRKGFYVAHYLLKKVEDLNATDKKVTIKTWSRRSMIIPAFVGHTFLVHNGKKFVPVQVGSHMLGYKLGAFAPTRTFKAHKTKSQVKKGKK